MTLYTYRKGHIPLIEALAGIGPSAIALVYAPGWCGFAVHDGGKLSTPAGEIPKESYEVRAFNELAELRWLKESDTAEDKGTAVIICESEVELKEWKVISREVDRLESDTTYLLWGEVTNRHPLPGWGEVATPRVGAIAVPDAENLFRPRSRVLLHSVEYIANDEFGSAYITEERLTKLSLRKGD